MKKVDHVRKARERRGLGMAKEWYEVPAYYYSGTSMIYPSGSSVPYPAFTSELDYEMEIAAVVGKCNMLDARGFIIVKIFLYL